MKNIIVSGEWISSKNERMGLTADNGDREKRKKRRKGNKRKEKNGREWERKKRPDKEW